MSAKEFGDFESKENDEMMTDFSFLLMECLRLLIESNKENARFFRQFRGADCAHNLIPFQCARPYTLKIIQQLIVDGSHDDLSMYNFFNNSMQLAGIWDSKLSFLILKVFFV